MLTGTDGIFVDIHKAERELEQLKAEISDKRNWQARRHEWFKHEYEKAHAEWAKVIEYIDEFNKSLLDAETPEARDRLRIAQMYVNSVDVDTKYDNTAFIIGLSEILAGHQGAAIEKLKKVNPRIPDPSVLRI